MKHLLSTIILVIAFTTVQSQTCGDLIVTNNTPDDYTFAWVTGDGATCNTMIHSGSPGFNVFTSNSLTTSALTAPIPGSYDWMGIHIIAVNTTVVSDPYPNSWTSSLCYWTGSTFNITWTSPCSVEINP
ncbi:MAG: hypothetical protein JKY48_08750 [Flavobacteriales bacterium]|nr:hypothetical protein [Flavobacteriales bacterium]